MPSVRVFIENEAGSDLKHHHDEQRFVVTLVERVGAPFPYPYGFVPGTLAPDGDAVDCFVITGRPLQTGDMVTAEIVGLMEQTDGGGGNHNVVAVLPGDPPPDLGSGAGGARPVHRARCSAGSPAGNRRRAACCGGG